MNTKIAISLGDPGGIGPEVTLKALKEIQHPLTIKLYGSECLFQPFQSLRHHQITYCHCYDLNQPIHQDNNAINGSASFTYLKQAVEDAMAKKIMQLVTAPISKTAWQQAGIHYTGHTTALKALSNAETVSMAFYTPNLKTILATIHIPLMQVSSQLTQERLNVTFEHAQLLCQQLGITAPKIAVAGLNPHAGEGGLFGTEEQKIKDIIDKSAVTVLGPYPPDTLYHRAYQGEFDIVVSLYHDQGLIPIKLIGFHDAVNVTVGLPFIRTSPDHGTAFDIVGQDQADPSSMQAAIELTQQLNPPK